jgi:Protein of unknown function (DUF3106)
MNRLPQALGWLVLCAAGQMLAFTSSAQDSAGQRPPVKLVSTATNFMPPVLQPRSPVEIFRQLLAMSPQERVNYLANRTPENRKRILAKLSEYQALTPDERELRLRATELRWYLLPLLKESPADRDTRLAQVPDALRGLVKSRLAQWDALSPQSRREFLDNERTLHYFSHVDPTNAPSAGARERGPSDAEQAHWQALTADERQRITTRFNQFFELTPDEKQKALNALSVAERAQMEKALEAFDKLPRAQRIQCVQAFTKFASMTTQDRADFLKNAARWSQLPPQERQAWRDLVAQVPLWPPLPPALMRPPPLPPTPSATAQSALHVHSLVATNRN